jgi:hypothetical protein
VRRIGCRPFQGHPSVYHDKPVPRTVAAWIPNAFAVGEATGRQLGAFYPSQAIDFWLYSTTNDQRCSRHGSIGR